MTDRITVTRVMDPRCIDYGSTIYDTAIGQVVVQSDGFTAIDGTPEELDRWAHRPNYRWPASQLAWATDNVSALYTADGDLDDLQHPGIDDVDAHEFSAWSSDLLTLAGLTDHPAIRSNR